MKIRERLIQRIEQMLAAYGPGGQLQLADVVTLLKQPRTMTGAYQQRRLQALIDVAAVSGLPVSSVLIVATEFIANLPNEPTLYVPGVGHLLRPNRRRRSREANPIPSGKPSAQARSRAGSESRSPADRRVGVLDLLLVAGYSRSHRSKGTQGRWALHRIQRQYINMTERDSCG